MIEIYYKSIRDSEFQLIDEYKAGSWIHVDKANIHDLNKLSEITQIDIADLHDSLDKHEIPRIEQKNNNIILFLRHPEESEEGLHTATIAIILTPSFIITISPHENKLIDSVISSKINLATTQKSKMLLFFLLKITHDFTLKIKKVRYAVIEQEKKMKNVDNSSIVMLTKNEEKLNQYLASIVPVKTLLEVITSGRYVNLYEKDQDLLEDLLIALKQSEDVCRVNVKSIRSLRDAYQILFTNDVNKTIKLLTAITIIFTIPTIIASLYGMNVKLPFAGQDNAFLIIVISTVVFCFLSLWLFFRKKWL